MILSGLRHLDLELAEARAFTAFSRLLDVDHLHLSSVKSEILKFAKPRKLECKPATQFYGMNLHRVFPRSMRHYR